MMLRIISDVMHCGCAFHSGQSLGDTRDNGHRGKAAKRNVQGS